MGEFQSPTGSKTQRLFPVLFLPLLKADHTDDGGGTLRFSRTFLIHIFNNQLPPRYPTLNLTGARLLGCEVLSIPLHGWQKYVLVESVASGQAPKPTSHQDVSNVTYQLNSLILASTMDTTQRKPRLPRLPRRRSGSPPCEALW